MKIELRNIKINLTFSEETTMFKADVYVDGKKVAYANNDGHGGSTFYNRYEKMEGLLKEAEAYAKTLPSTTHTFGNTSMVIESTLENIIDNEIDRLVNEKETEKFKKKLEKDKEKNICFGVPNGKSYRMIGWKGLTISQLLASPNGRQGIQNAIKKIEGELKEGEVILNNNLLVGYIK